jgi:periplasmic divalent cation tolerance protein
VRKAKEERVVLVTCGAVGEARKIAEAVVGAGLAACVNLITAPVESVYRWKEKVERANEWLLVMKTTEERLSRLEAEVKRLHSYELPEFLVLEVKGGSAEYLKWLRENLRNR